MNRLEQSEGILFFWWGEGVFFAPTELIEAVVLMFLGYKILRVSREIYSAE